MFRPDKHAREPARREREHGGHGRESDKYGRKPDKCGRNPGKGSDRHRGDSEGYAMDPAFKKAMKNFERARAEVEGVLQELSKKSSKNRVGAENGRRGENGRVERGGERGGREVRAGDERRVVSARPKK